MGGPGLAGPVGLDAADRLGGGPPDGAYVVAAQVDGDGVLGDVDGDDAPGVDAPERDFLPGDHDDTSVAGPPLDGDGLSRRPWWWPGGAGALQPACLFPGQRAGPGAQQLAGERVEEHQGVLLDADADAAAAEDLRGQDVASGIYMYRVEAASFTFQDRFVVIR